MLTDKCMQLQLGDFPTNIRSLKCIKDVQNLRIKINVSCGRSEIVSGATGGNLGQTVIVPAAVLTTLSITPAETAAAVTTSVPTTQYRVAGARRLTESQYVNKQITYLAHRDINAFIHTRYCVGVLLLAFLWNVPSVQ